MITRLGVVGHRGYDGLSDVLTFLAREAPVHGLSLHVEGSLAELVPGAATLARRRQSDP